MINKIMELKNLTVSTRENSKILLNNINLTIKKGKTIGIVGQSGSGKTLLSKVLCGILPQELTITSGEIIFDGINRNGLQKDYLGKGMSYMFQNSMTALNPVKTIDFNFSELLTRNKPELNKKDQLELKLAILNKIGITEPLRVLTLYPYQLSGGMQQRIVLALHLLTEPSFFIVDEPTTSLDVISQMNVMEILEDYCNKEHNNLVLVSHDISAVAKLCEYLIVMYQGRIVEEGETLTILEKSNHPYTKLLINSLIESRGPIL